MSVATLISRVLGYIKDMILAGFFGATGTADVFFVAFRIPNLLRELFAEGSMSSAFIPILTEYQTKQGREEANRLVRATFRVIVLFVGFICLLGIAAAPYIVSLIAPGFLPDTEKFSMTVLLTRIMFPFLLFISLASLTMGALNTRGTFFVPAFAPALLNIVIIASIFTLSSSFADPIIAVAIGVTAGGLVQFLIQTPAFFREGFSFFRTGRHAKQAENIPGKNAEPFLHPGVRRIGMLIIPSTAGLAVAQINIFISTILASYLPEGSITYLYYSMRLIQFPIGIFGVAMGMAALPALSEHAAKGDLDRLKEDFSFSLRLLFFITVPAMIGLIALRVPIVSTLFQRGLFGPEATIGTSDALMFYSVGIWAIVGVRIITAGFYSLQDTKTPVKVAFAAVMINIALSLVLMGPLKHNGLALATALASCFNFTMLFFLLRRRLGHIGTGRILTSFAKTAGASIVMGIAGWFVVTGPFWMSGGEIIRKAAYLLFSILLCVGVYCAAAFLFRSEEMGYLAGKLRKR